MKKLYSKINELWLKCRQWSNSNILGYLIVGGLKIAIIAIIGFYGLFVIGPFKNVEGPVAADMEQEDCNVTGINLHGTLATYIPLHAEGDTLFNYDSVSSEDILWSIKQANNNPKIKAIVVEVDSSGGSPVAGEEIAAVIKNSEKPVISFIRDIGASSAYWAISTSDKILASKNSEVGSIGITMSYISNVKNNEKEGFKYERLSSGKFKDSGSPDLPLTEEERGLFMRDVKIMYQNFVEAISSNRNIPIDKVESIADGSMVLGEKALELNLIDEIGGISEVENLLRQEIEEEPSICWE